MTAYIYILYISTVETHPARRLQCRVHCLYEGFGKACLKWTCIGREMELKKNHCQQGSPIITVFPTQLPSSLSNKCLHSHFIKQGTLQRKSNLCIPFLGLRGLSPNFHIHVSVSDWYIPRIRPHISCSRIGRLIVGIYKSFTDTWMWKSGLWPRNPFSGNICFEFSVLVLCSVSVRIPTVIFTTMWIQSWSTEVEQN